ncbi:cell division protein SepF [Phytoactinopolyspora halotolerans]|uniref:Cell division protein SepF n=1 Tax=Phytoactinopolyspora halotolerans TaxID=1981512 RepID=A0A6L9SG97_9ACTN|nr:cell division protein SepF [Phytoactinopolyspora halotolerans]NEE03100.1 cell division protein SepF [Phytoactinopolyspora halotolerans]
MASAMRKVAVYLGLVEDRDRYDDEYDDEYDEPYEGDYEDELVDAHEPPEPERLPERRERDREHPREHTATVSSLADRRPAAGQRRATATREARITTLHPRTYNEARVLGEHFRDGIPVIMNLSEMDDVDAKRLVDFAAGLIFGLRGSIDRITAKVFLLTPADVQVTAEDKARIADGAFFNQS